MEGSERNPRSDHDADGILRMSVKLPTRAGLHFCTSSGTARKIPSRGLCFVLLHPTSPVEPRRFEHRVRMSAIPVAYAL